MAAEAASRRHLLAVAAVAAAAGLLLYLLLRFFSTPALTEIGYYRFEPPRPVELPPLLDDTAAPLTEATFAGRWSLVFFGYTSCPDVCPVTLSLISEALAQLPAAKRDRLQVFLVTVDPEVDDPKRLRAYLERFGDRYHGITGSHSALATLATGLNAAFAKVPGRQPGTYVIDHSANLVMLDPQVRYDGQLRMPQESAVMARVLDSLVD